MHKPAANLPAEVPPTMECGATVYDLFTGEVLHNPAATVGAGDLDQPRMVEPAQITELVHLAGEHVHTRRSALVRKLGAAATGIRNWALGRKDIESTIAEMPDDIWTDFKAWADGEDVGVDIADASISNRKMSRLLTRYQHRTGPRHRADPATQRVVVPEHSFQGIGEPTQPGLFDRFLGWAEASLTNTRWGTAALGTASLVGTGLLIGAAYTSTETPQLRADEANQKPAAVTMMTPAPQATADFLPADRLDHQEHYTAAPQIVTYTVTVLPYTGEANEQGYQVGTATAAASDLYAKAHPGKAPSTAQLRALTGQLVEQAGGTAIDGTDFRPGVVRVMLMADGYIHADRVA